MGQSNSSDGGLNNDMVFLQNKLAGQLKVLSRLAFLRHRELVESIEELNTVTKDFVDRHGKRLCFSIRRGTDTTLLWKSTIRIRCLKLNTRNKNIESARLLTLRQFIVMYKEIKDQIAMLSIAHDSIPRKEQRTAATATSEVEQQEEEPGSSKSYTNPSCPQEGAASPEETLKKEVDIGKDEKFTASAFFPDDICEDSSECCVCMDRKACIMLSCAHEFCEPCIDSWTRDSSHSTCPSCRSKVQGNDDAWVLTDKNDRGDYEQEVTGYLVGLADRKGTAE